MRHDVPVMTEDRPSEVLGALPHTRPHRRSQKRAARPPANGADRPPANEAQTAPESRPSSPRRRTAPRKQPLRQPAQPAGTPAAPRARKPAPAGRPDVLGTAVQAAAELAEIGLTVSARVLRGAVSRLPRP